MVLITAGLLLAVVVVWTILLVRALGLLHALSILCAGPVAIIVIGTVCNRLIRRKAVKRS